MHESNDTHKRFTINQDVILTTTYFSSLLQEMDFFLWKSSRLRRGYGGRMWKYEFRRIVVYVINLKQ